MLVLRVIESSCEFVNHFGDLRSIEAWTKFPWLFS